MNLLMTSLKKEKSIMNLLNNNKTKALQLKNVMTQIKTTK